MILLDDPFVQLGSRSDGQVAPGYSPLSPEFSGHVQTHSSGNSVCVVGIPG